MLERGDNRFPCTAVLLIFPYAFLDRLRSCTDSNWTQVFLAVPPPISDSRLVSIPAERRLRLFRVSRGRRRRNSGRCVCDPPAENAPDTCAPTGRSRGVGTHATSPHRRWSS